MTLDKTFHKSLFNFAHSISYPRFFKTYEILSEKKTLSELKEQQNKLLSEMIIYSYNELKYYKNLFDSLKLIPNDIKNTNDLIKLPILTKEIIKQHREDFKPKNINSIPFTLNSTGGTTGTPFTYRISKEDRFMSLALLYRGWGKAGYNPADRMVFLAGASLGVSAKSSISKYAYEKARNIKKLSSFAMSDKNLIAYTKMINDFKPKFIRGYPSAIYYYSRWIKDRNIKISHPSAIFVTAEKLFPQVRSSIEEVFQCSVFDAYGLNDGGLSAFECSVHSGMHLDTERGYAEVANENGQCVYDKEGKIIATTLLNTAMPLIRYDTGDIGIITKTTCTCGDPHPILKELVGRSVDVLVTPEGTAVHGWFFLYTFWKYYKGIKEYQVIQKSPTEIEILIVKDGGFDPSILVDIEATAKKVSPNWVLKFKYVDSINRTQSGKYKFIINNIK